ncbi:MAG TPA: DUF892 family protein [Opitutales bacterium]|nr:DUF892 family protein [Opitutales bacterium]
MNFKKSLNEDGNRWRHYFLEELRELYRTEKRWMIILPEVTRNLPAPEIERTVLQHLEQMVAKVNHLERIFERVAAVDQEESRAIRPILREAGTVLIAVTRSTAEVRKQVAVRSAVPKELAEKLPPWMDN